MPATPIVERPAGAALFHRPVGPVGAVAFLADAGALAVELPAATHVVNLCRDRYAFAVTFAAALIRGVPCLLPGETSDARLTAVDAAFPGSVVVIDGSPDGTDACPMPAVVARPRGRVPGGPVPNPAVPADRLAAIVFTSGSTGAPVGHRKTWGELVARSRAAASAFGLDEDAPPVVVGTVPPGHMYGLETTVLLPLHAPASSWCGPAFYPADVAAALDALSGRRLLVTTPLQLRGLLPTRLPALRAVISATAPLDPALAAAAEAAWDAPVHEIFGATEVGSVARRRTTEGEWWTPYPGVELAGGAEIVVRAPGAAPTPLADELAFDGAGFRLLGRRADVVKVGGRRASLAGLNRILLEVDGVADGAFVLPDEREGAAPRLQAVVVAPRRSADAILADLRGRIDPVFLPRRVLRVDALPRNELGKLPRGALLALLAS